MSNIRLTGIASGMDTEQMIKDLMKAERGKLDRVNQEKQLSEWRRESYQDIIEKLQSIQNDFFDITKAEKNIWSKSMYGQFTSSIMSNGVTTSALSIQGTADMKSRELTINKISQLATKDKWNGLENDIRGVKTSGFDFSKVDAATGDFSFVMAIDGSAKAITITEAEIDGTSDINSFAALLNTKIGEKYGSDYNSVVSVNGSELEFDNSGNEIILMNKDGGEALGTMNVIKNSTGFASSYDYKSKNIGDLFGVVEGDVGSLSINGITDFGIVATDKISDVVKKINSSKADVTVTYNNLADRFEIVSNKEGSLNGVDFDNQATKDFFAKLGVTDAGHIEAKNAKVTINNVEITKTSNSFNYEGMLITLNDTHDTGNDINVKMEVNTKPIIDNIKSFVAKYNETIKELHDLTSQKRNYDYKPLTTEQRKELSDEEAKKWDEKAKAGLLRSSSEIDGMLTKLRQAFYEPVDGVGISLKDIGITSSNVVKDHGKLIIDEAKLEESLKNDYDNVVKLFTNESDKKYLSKGNEAERYKENGIGHRIDDILDDYVRITRDNDGNKGILVEKSGTKGSALQTDTIAKEILAFNKRITTITDYLSDKESSYYRQFAAMEKALSQLQSQSSWIAQQMGGA